MTLHVVFTKHGIPGWIGSEPREGSEPVEGLGIAFLAGHRRVKGQWVAREPLVPPEPTPEELAARAEAEVQAAVDDRAVAVRRALAEEADPLFFKWQRGECDREDWIAKVAEIKARFPETKRL